jgi:IclR family KDG regulon transcriptional repressor
VDFKKFREKTITTMDAYLAELTRTREQGYGEDREEFDDHIRCIGVPIFDRLGNPIAGLSISFPTFRFNEADAPKFIHMLKEASRTISASMGCSKDMLA